MRSIVIERLEADVRGAEFMGRDFVPVERKRLAELLEVVRAAEGLLADLKAEGGWDDGTPIEAALEPLFHEVPS